MRSKTVRLFDTIKEKHVEITFLDENLAEDAWLSKLKEMTEQHGENVGMGFSIQVPCTIEWSCPVCGQAFSVPVKVQSGYLDKCFCSCGTMFWYNYFVRPRGLFGSLFLRNSPDEALPVWDQWRIKEIQKAAFRICPGIMNLDQPQKSFGWD